MFKPYETEHYILITDSSIYHKIYLKGEGGKRTLVKEFMGSYVVALSIIKKLENS